MSKSKNYKSLCKVKKLIVILLFLNKSKNWWSFCWLWRVAKLILQQNSLRKNWMLSQPSLACLLSYSLPKHPVFLFNPLFPTQSVRLPLVTLSSLCSTCVTYREACHSIGHQVLPTQPLPRKAEDFPRGGPSEAEDFTGGGNNSKHVPLLTYEVWLQPARLRILIGIYIFQN